MNTEERIARFYRTRGASLAYERYRRLDPDGYYTYLFRPEPRAIRWLADRIAGPGFSRRVGRSALVAAAHTPALLAAIPRISRVDVAVPSERFDVAIESGTRLTLLDFDEEIVWTLPFGDADALRTTIDIRQSLPSELPIPTVVEVDETYP